MESFERGYAATPNGAVEEALLKACEENGENHSPIFTIDSIHKVQGGGYKANVRITYSGGDEACLEILARGIHDISLLAMYCGCDFGKISSAIMAERNHERLQEETAEFSFFRAGHVSDIPPAHDKVPDIHDVIGKAILPPHPQPLFRNIA